MRCDNVAVNLPDYLLGKIEPNLRKSIEAHLALCERCRQELEGMREPLRILGEVGHEEYPDSFFQQLHASIMDRIAEPQRIKWKVPVFAGGLAVILLAVGIGIFENSRKPAALQYQTVAALATSLPPEQVVSLPSMNVNYVDAVSSQADEYDEMAAVDDSVQQAVVNALWNSVSDSTGSLDAVYYYGNSPSN